MRWDDETVQDAIDVLQDLVLWELTAQRWEHAARILDRIAAALSARDVEELRDAVAELELSGPVRLSRIGSALKTGIPQPVFDRRNTLVHALTAEQPMQPEDDRGRQKPR